MMRRASNRARAGDHHIGCWLKHIVVANKLSWSRILDERGTGQLNDGKETLEEGMTF